MTDIELAQAIHKSASPAEIFNSVQYVMAATEPPRIPDQFTIDCALVLVRGA